MTEKQIRNEAMRKVMWEVGHTNNDVTRYISDAVANQVIRDENGGWIPVDERLPEPGREVLAYIKHNYAEDGWRAYRVYEYTDHWVGMGNLCEVIAWMPLPEPFIPQN